MAEGLQGFCDPAVDGFNVRGSSVSDLPSRTYAGLLNLQPYSLKLKL